MPTKDVRATAIDDLEVSVKTASFLQGLGVETLGDLLARPRIEAPKLVASELVALFDELEVGYDGEVVSEKRAAPKKASGGVAQRMAAIEAWLDENEPHLLEDFRAPAPEADVAAVESALGRKLPAEYVDFLKLHDGQEDGAPMIATCTLLPVGLVPDEHARLVRLFEGATAPDPSAVDAGIKKVAYTPAWIPIGRSARGRDILCLDLDPDKGGKAGQVILLAVDDDARNLIAGGIGELLGQYFEAVQNGELDDEDEDELDEDLDDEDLDDEVPDDEDLDEA